MLHCSILISQITDRAALQGGGKCPFSVPAGIHSNVFLILLLRCREPKAKCSTSHHGRYTVSNGLLCGGVWRYRLHSRLTMMYKISNGLVEVPQEYHPAPRPRNSARGHPRQFQRFQPTVDAFKYAFLTRPFQPGMLFHKQLLRRTRLIYSSDI